MGNAVSAGLFVFSSNTGRRIPFPFSVSPLACHTYTSVSQFLLVSLFPCKFHLLSKTNLTLSCLKSAFFFSPLYPQSSFPVLRYPFLQCSFLNSVSCHPDYFFHYKIFLVYLTISVASSSCPDISRLYTPLTFPVTRLSCFVAYLNLYSPFILPDCQVHISYQSIYILFLLLYLPGKEKNREKNKDNFSVPISIFSMAMTCRNEDRELQGKSCFIQHQDKLCSVQMFSLENLVAKLYKTFPVVETGNFPTLF